MRALLAALLAVPLLGAAAHGAEPVRPVSVRTGRHPGFVRMVFDFRGPIAAHLKAVGRGEYRLVVAGHRLLDLPRSLPPGMTGMQHVADGAVFHLRAGAHLRSMRLGDRLVIDVLPSPVRQEKRQAGADHAEVSARQSHDHVATVPLPATPPPAMHADVAPPSPAPVPVVAVDAAPMPTAGEAVPSPVAAPAAASLGLAARPLDSHGDGAAMLLPFGPDVGAAAFRRGGFGMVVFDRREAIDLGAVRGDPLLGNARIIPLAGGTLLRIPLDPAMAITLTHNPQGWRVAVRRTRMAFQSLPLRPAHAMLRIAAPGRGAVVRLSDPLSGATLLVGTEHDAGAGVPAAIRAPQFHLLATWQGVVVRPLSDGLHFGVTQSGYRLDDGGAGLLRFAGTPGGLSDPNATSLAARFNFPDRPISDLVRRLQDRMQAAAEAPSLARAKPRRAVAEAMLALGMGVEADGVLRLAAKEDPAEAVRPAHLALAEIARIVAGTPRRAEGEPDPLADPRLSGFDDIALWRALRKAERHPGAPDAAAILGVTAPLIETWPAPLRRRFLPIAAETMVEGGAASAAAAILTAHPGDHRLDFARALLKQKRGDVDGALAIFDRLALSPDRKIHARASVRAVNLRLASGRLDAGGAADALDRMLYAWRGGRRERALREEVADLRARAGAWRRSLAMLRRSEQLFPAARPELQARLRKVFAAMLRNDALAKMAPAALVALLDDNADLLPSGPAGEVLDAHLADRLLALDLPDRAVPLLRRLMQAAPSPGAKATFGARLASVLLRQGDAAGAREALAESDALHLRPALTQRRALLAAKVDAALGHPTAAAASLAALNTPAADIARAAILEQAKDWPAAERALASYVAKTIPASGPIDDAQRRTLLRLATATAQAGDQSGLAALRAQNAGRMAGGPLGDLFTLLTAAPITDLADLQRAAHEAALAGHMAHDIQTVQAANP